jgi:ribosome-binding protein aMBF1 (putative translation factor)
MNECFKCGVSGDEVRLFEVITNQGIFKICNRCFSEESFPLLKKPTTFQLKESERQQTYREKVEHFHKSQIMLSNSKKEDISLKNLVDRNLKIKIKEEITPRPDLVDNFNWVIMRARRAKHVSREQFAKDLGESETLIKMVERGILPENDNLIINKVEGYLGIKLRRLEFRQEPQQKEMGFDSISVKNLTISDLREMKNEKEENILLKPVDVWEGDIETGSKEDAGEPEPEEEKVLSQEEIDDLIFGKRT